MQRHWSDNQVSCTATFNPETEAGQIGEVLEAYEDRVKALSFLPLSSHGYEQAPYEAIAASRYGEMMARIRPLKGLLEHEEQMETRFCDGDFCEAPALDLNAGSVRSPQA
jgi:hypothetical protein